jgi:hypothetical protein
VSGDDLAMPPAFVGGTAARAVSDVAGDPSVGIELDLAVTFVGGLMLVLAGRRRTLSRPPSVAVRRAPGARVPRNSA